jgi:hypothetical protein
MQLLREWNLSNAPRTAAGYGQLAWRSAWLYPFSMGWPTALLAAAGVVTAIARPARRWWLWLLLVPLSIYTTFVCVALYVNDRYQLGGIVALTFFAAAAAGDLLDVRRWRRATGLVVAAAVIVAALYACSVNVMKTRDARKAAARWLVEHADRETVATTGGYLPRLDPRIRAIDLEPSTQALNAGHPRYLLVNLRFAQRWSADAASPGAALLGALGDGSAGYDEAFRYRAPLPVWALLKYASAFRSPIESDYTNLDKLNPEVAIFVRRN